MFMFIAWYIKLLTAILGWGSFLFSGLTGVALLLARKRKCLGWCCAVYAVAFLIVRFFFAEFYFRWMPGIAIFLAIISMLQSHYVDCVNRKRWWNW
jgi:hypothetical protein